MSDISAGQVCVVFRARADRLTLDTFADLFREYPWVSRSPLDRMVAMLAAQVPQGQAPAMLGAFVAVTHEMGALTRTLPYRLRSRMRSCASREQILLLSLIEAGQKGDTGRAIEAAIALLDTGCVHRVVTAAKSLGTKLAQCGLIVSHVPDALFAAAVGYPTVPDHDEEKAPEPQNYRGPPTLRLLHSA